MRLNCKEREKKDNVNDDDYNANDGNHSHIDYDEEAGDIFLPLNCCELWI